MSKVALTAWLLLAGSLVGPLAIAKNPTPLVLHKGARVGVINMMDAEVTHFHDSKVLTQSFFKTYLVGWQVEAMLNEAVTQRLTELGLVVAPMGASDSLMRNRDEYFVNNSVAKKLPREVARQFAQLAASEQIEALIVLAPGVNESSQGPVRKGLPENIRGWGFLTNDSNGPPTLFNITQVLLIGIEAGNAALNAREWGSGYSDEWVNHAPPAEPKRIPPDELNKLQPLFNRILAQQVGHVLDSVTVTP
jgi:hypothetical protein